MDPSDHDGRAGVGVLLNDVIAAHPDPIVLVLDDPHVITDPDAFSSLGYLLDHAPPQVRVVATARTEPPLGIARRRTHGRLITGAARTAGAALAASGVLLPVARILDIAAVALAVDAALGVSMILPAGQLVRTPGLLPPIRQPVAA